MAASVDVREEVEGGTPDRRRALSRGEEMLRMLAPTLLAVLVMAGGWVYNWAANDQRLHDQDRRIAALEAAAVTRPLFEAVLGTRDQQLKDMAEQMALLRVQLDKIDAKLDDQARRRAP